MRRLPRFYPPVYFLFSLIVMVVLHYLFPVVQWLDWPWRAIGIAIFAAAVALGLVATGELQRRKTTVVPLEESRMLITDGPYRFTRNPVYLSLALALLGLAVALGSLSPLIVVPIFMWWITARFIILEEQHLTEQFGPTYTAYKSQVRRWL